ncbi:hypothetical protein FBUS_06742 [Fasciolopsis buskii]|uniref:CUB domain-containing protein n=1 Tax=Fasciolopsis buskii TaxID=27845 RepID=A0A8E0VL62_9TREM|nr:hypothetical protein FBUS_06742 [Fasciolopsis buski]
MSCTLLSIALLLFSCGIINNVVAQQNLCGPTTLQLTKQSTEFTVPSGGTFSQSTVCQYSVTGSAGKTLTLKVTSLSVSNMLGKGLTCDKDYIKVAENKASLNSTQQYACGTRPTEFSVQTNQMALEIKVTEELASALVKATIVQSKFGHETGGRIWGFSFS